MAKFNWGAALMTAGDRLGQYAEMKRQQEQRGLDLQREDQRLASNRAWEESLIGKRTAAAKNLAEWELDLKDPMRGLPGPDQDFGGWGVMGDSPSTGRAVDVTVPGDPQWPVDFGQLGLSAPSAPMRHSAMSDYITQGLTRQNNLLDYDASIYGAEARAQAAANKPQHGPLSDEFMLDAVVPKGSEEAYWRPTKRQMVQQMYGQLVQQGWQDGSQATMDAAERMVDEQGLAEADLGLSGLQYDRGTDSFYDPLYEEAVPGKPRSIPGFPPFMGDILLPDQDPELKPTTAWSGWEDMTGSQRKEWDNRRTGSRQYFIDRLKDPLKKGYIRPKDLEKLTNWGLTMDEIQQISKDAAAAVNSPGGGEDPSPNPGAPVRMDWAEMERRRQARLQGGAN